MEHTLTDAERTELLNLTKAACDARHDVMCFTGGRISSDYKALETLRYVWHTCKAIGITTTALDLAAAADACEAAMLDLDDGLWRSFTLLGTRLRDAAGAPNDDDMAICENCALHGIEEPATLRSQMRDWAGDDDNPYLCAACDNFDS